MHTVHIHNTPPFWLQEGLLFLQIRHFVAMMNFMKFPISRAPRCKDKMRIVLLILLHFPNLLQEDENCTVKVVIVLIPFSKRWCRKPVVSQLQVRFFSVQSSFEYVKQIGFDSKEAPCECNNLTLHQGNQNRKYNAWLYLSYFYRRF